MLKIEVLLLACASLLFSAELGAQTSAQGSAGGPNLTATATVGSVVRQSFPSVKINLTNLQWQGGARHPQQMTVDVNLPGDLRLKDARVERLIGAWYLQGQDRVRVSFNHRVSSTRRVDPGGNRVEVQSPAEYEIWSIERIGRGGAVTLPPSGGDGSDPKALSLEVKAQPARVPRTGKVNFTFTVKNTSDRAVTYQTPSGQRFDFEVLKGKEVVWNWAHGRMFTMAIGSVTLQPGQSRVFQAQWDLKDNRGSTVAPGTYQVQAYLSIMGSQRPAAPPVELVVM